MRRILNSDGWYVVENRGRHIQLEHAVKKGKVTVLNHNGGYCQRYFEQYLQTSRIKIRYMR
jgi:predicted RNA binding protein YcfA (HicA-like mRNA interferase family)